MSISIFRTCDVVVDEEKDGSEKRIVFDDLCDSQRSSFLCGFKG
jgi:hypothetical protein